MENGNNKKQYILIILGILIMLVPFVSVDLPWSWVNIVLGAAVILIAVWLLFPEKDKTWHEIVNNLHERG